MDALDPEAVAAATGWHVVHHARTASTNDDVARLRDAGVPPRTAVVADAQEAGRGRAGRGFASPPGGLYVSLLVGARPEDVPARLVALSAVSLAEVLADAGVPDVLVKWPNDIWIARRKAAGILLEAVAGDAHAIIGIGLNVSAVPEGLPQAVAAGVTAVAEHVAEPPSRETLLIELLRRVDAWHAQLAAPAGVQALEAAWTARLALIGERVRLDYAGRELSGRFEAASLTQGLLIRHDEAGPIWRDAALAADLRPT